VQVSQTNNSSKIYDANHLYVMTIAHIKRNKESKATPRSNHAKKTYPKIAKLVPVFAARERSICKYFITPEIKRPEKTNKNNNSI